MFRKQSQIIGAVLLAVTLQTGSAVTIANNFDTDPLWTGFNNTSGGNSYGYSPGTTVAGGTAGEVGGTFRRINTENYYADTNNFGVAGEVLSLARPFQGSGKFDATNTLTMDNIVEVGHRSKSTDDSFVGLGVFEGVPNTSIRVAAQVTLSDQTLLLGSLTFLPIHGDYWFSYSYDPSGGVNAQGRLTLMVTNSLVSFTNTVDLTAANRATGATLDAFGIGNYRSPATTAQGDVFIDDVTYTALPEPSSLALLGAGALLLLRRRSQ